MIRNPNGIWEALEAWAKFGRGPGGTKVKESDRRCSSALPTALAEVLDHRIEKLIQLLIIIPRESFEKGHSGGCRDVLQIAPSLNRPIGEVEKARAALEDDVIGDGKGELVQSINQHIFTQTDFKRFSEVAKGSKSAGVDSEGDVVLNSADRFWKELVHQFYGL